MNRVKGGGSDLTSESAVCKITFCGFGPESDEGLVVSENSRRASGKLHLVKINALPGITINLLFFNDIGQKKPSPEGDGYGYWCL